MTYLLRGALIEYGSDFLGPLPNVVIFQFNPEMMTRNLQIPARPTGGARRETTQAGDPPIERITIKAEFDAADLLNSNNAPARRFGVGPQLAALEKMVYPSNTISGLIGQAIDEIGNALRGGGNSSPPNQLIPREKYPRILFIWGKRRVLPVTIDSMSITEQQYDFLLNPVRAEVSIGLSVNALCTGTDDTIAKGAMEYSNLVKEAQAILNQATTEEAGMELVPF
jgi:hypothetical protein